MGTNNKNKLAPGMMFALCLPGLASANPEAPGMYDARNNGMGGAGIAYLDSPAAVMHNPANLANTRGSQQQFDITMLAVKLTGSFAGPEHEQESPWIVAPLPFMGYQTRINEDWTWGWSFYMSLGFGGGYEDVKQYGTGKTCTDSLDDVFVIAPGGGGVLLNPAAQHNDYCPPYGRDETVQLALFELAFPFTYEVRDDLRVGVSLRFPFGMFTQSTSEDIVGAFVPPEQANGSYGLGYAQVESEMYGVGTPGYLVGVTYDITSYLSLAAAYRSKVTTTMKGDTQLYLESNILVGAALGSLGNVPIGNLAEAINSIPDIGPLLAAQIDDDIGSFANRIASDIDSQLEWTTARTLELGFALRITPSLMFAGDWKHQYLEEANKDFIVELNEPLFQKTGLNQLGQVLNWKDVYSWSLGLEYTLEDNEWVRFGYSFGNSATPPEYSNAFTPPPADHQDSFYVGYGVKLGKWQYDVGFNYATVEYEIAQPYDAEGNPVDTPNCRPGQLTKSGCPGNMGVETFFLALSANYILP
ncbi:MAG TPA: outer membrane protein transport protein [Dongiaceae bacterium]|nr:outer membrane protein transport protein [Dongiaceae bacterium]